MATVGVLQGRSDEHSRNTYELIEFDKQHFARAARAVGVLLFSDLVAVIAALALLRSQLLPQSVLSTTILAMGACVYGLALFLFGLYPGRGLMGTTRLRLRALVVVIAFMPPAMLALTLHAGRFGPTAAEYSFIAAALFLLGSLFELIAIQIADAFGFWRSPAILVGAPGLVAQITRELQIFPELGLELLQPPPPRRSDAIALETSGPGRRRQAMSSYVVDQTSPLLAFYPAGREHVVRHGTRTSAAGATAARTFKRAIDVIGAAVALLLFSPILLACAIGILLIDGRPIFFCQDRGGKDGKMFCVWKIRTMYRDAQQRLDTLIATDPKVCAEWHQFFKLRNDPRILPIVGSFIRKASLDEVPQFWNVLRGDMSLVGPRPLPNNHLEAFHDEAFLKARSSVLPGVSGLWQVTMRSDGDLGAQKRLDTAYVEGWSLWLDIYVLLRTPLAWLSLRGAR